MPRKNPLSEAELEISNRVRLYRERRGLSRSSLAQELAVDSSLIANVEKGMTPVRYELAMRLFRRFWINPRWLATGSLPMQFYIQFYGARYALPPRTLFSKAYTEALAEGTERALIQTAGRVGCRVEELDEIIKNPSLLRANSPDAVAERKRSLEEWAGDILMKLPPSLHEEFLLTLSAASENFFRSYAPEIDLYRANVEAPVPPETRELWRRLAKWKFAREQVKEETSLTSVTLKVTHEVMASDLYDSLIERVSDATTAPGAKSALARSLGVPRQRVHEWLKGTGVPDGAKALLLLSWVETAEASQQKKTAPVLQTRKRQKTRKSKSNGNEKAKSDQRKK